MDGSQETAGGKAAMNALDALRYDWGSAYEIESADGEWRARRQTPELMRKGDET